MLSYLNESSAIIFSIAVILFAGFLLTRVTKKLRLPNVTGYIFAGVIVGPYVLNVIPHELIQHMDFMTDIALAFIAFRTGKYFKMSFLRERGKEIVLLTLFEFLITVFVVSIVMYAVFPFSLSFSILIGIIGGATASASTIVTVQQYHAKGDFVNTAMEVVALDNAVSLIAFSICLAVIQSLSTGEVVHYGTLLWPVFINLEAILIGGLCGFALRFLITPKRSREHRLVVTVAMLLMLTGFCTQYNISPLLSCMSIGAVYINTNGDEHLFKQVDRFTPPILTMFFVISGLKLDVPALLKAGFAGVVYCFVRILAKYLGTYIGGTVCHCSDTIKKYLGLALIPQAGVSIGLAALAQRVLPTETGVMLSTIILSSAVLYEIIGPVCAKRALVLSGAISKENLEA